MDSSLRLLLSVSRHLPKVRGIGKFSCMLRDFYARSKRTPVKTRIGTLTMTLNPNDQVESELLFHPQLFEREEIALVMGVLQPGDTFLDAGAHLGFYSLHAAQKVGAKGRVIAIEAHPNTFRRLTENFVTNNFPQCESVHQGISDAPGALNMTIHPDNSGANSFLVERSDNQITVQCDTLFNILKRKAVTSIRAAKFDLEGFEFRVIKKFFAEAERSYWPQYILIEFYPDQLEQAGGNTKELLLKSGYRIIWERKRRPNLFFERIDTKEG